MCEWNFTDFAKRHDAPHEGILCHLTVWHSMHLHGKMSISVSLSIVDLICVNYCGDCYAATWRQIFVTDLSIYITPCFSYVLVAFRFTVISITLMDLYSFALAQELIICLILLLQNCIIHPLWHSLIAFPLITADSHSSRPSHPSMYL